MGNRVRQGIHYSLRDMESLWGVCSSELRQWLTHGDLIAHIWLPLMTFYELSEETHGNQVVMTKGLSHREGYTPLYSHQCRSLYARGDAYLREFPKPDGGRYLLPDTAVDYHARLSELVILDEEQARFEKEHGIQRFPVCQNEAVSHPHERNMPAFDTSFKIVFFDGQFYRFGDIQSRILSLLYEAAQNSSPWLKGKRLLEEAGAQSYTLSNVFKRHPAWEQRIIESDGRGSYRLSPDFLASLSSK